MTDLPAIPDNRPLSAAEHQAYERCCQTVDSGLKTFIEVGEALAQLRDARLYRVQYAGCTFEQFVQERWQFTRQRAYQLISASQLALAAGDTVTVPSERIARALMPLKEEPGAARLALTVAIATAPDGKITAEWVESAVAVVQDAMGTEGLVDAGSNTSWTAMNAAITVESHKKMMEKRDQLRQNGHHQKPITFILSGEVLQAIAPEQVKITVEKTYRVVVYEIVEVDAK